jgi:ankyrin repeat protein
MNKNVAKKLQTGDNTSMDMPDIILAAEHGDVQTIEKALELGEDINIQETATGITALHAAVAGGHLHVIEFLVQHSDLSFDIKDKFGRSAVGLALCLPDDQIIETLRAAQLPDDDSSPQDGSPVLNFPQRDR